MPTKVSKSKTLLWQDPRSERVYTQGQVNAIKGAFLENGMLKKSLVPYKGERVLSKGAPKEETIEKTITGKQQKQ